MQKKQIQFRYVWSGLAIHEKHPFLSASPNVLVDNDGVIEIKCPYNMRHLKIKHVKIDFPYAKYNPKRHITSFTKFKDSSKPPITSGWIL